MSELSKILTQLKEDESIKFTCRNSSVTFELKKINCKLVMTVDSEQIVFSEADLLFYEIKKALIKIREAT